MTISFTLLQGSYIVAGLLFILALAGLSRHETAKSGNIYGIIGMAIALVFTIIAAVGGVTDRGETVHPGSGGSGLLLIAGAMAVAAVIGSVLLALALVAYVVWQLRRPVHRGG